MSSFVLEAYYINDFLYSFLTIFPILLTLSSLYKFRAIFRAREIYLNTKTIKTQNQTQIRSSETHFVDTGKKPQRCPIVLWFLRFSPYTHQLPTSWRIYTTYDACKSLQDSQSEMETLGGSLNQGTLESPNTMQHAPHTQPHP